MKLLVICELVAKDKKWIESLVHSKQLVKYICVIFLDLGHYLSVFYSAVPEKNNNNNNGFHFLATLDSFASEKSRAEVKQNYLFKFFPRLWLALRSFLTSMTSSYNSLTIFSLSLSSFKYYQNFSLIEGSFIPIVPIII